MSCPAATRTGSAAPMTRFSSPSPSTPPTPTGSPRCRPSWSEPSAPPSSPSDPAMRAEGGAHAAWPEMLRAALAGDGVRAVYQPIVDLARGVVVGYEALVRFAGHPVESPEPWFAAAHAHGCGAELQAAALRAALRHRRSLPRNCFLT